MSEFERAIKELQLGNYSEIGLMKESIETLEKYAQLAPGFANALEHPQALLLLD